MCGYPPSQTVVSDLSLSTRIANKNALKQRWFSSTFCILNVSYSTCSLHVIVSYTSIAISRPSLPLTVTVSHTSMAISNPMSGGHSCIDCLLSMRILLPRTNTRENDLTSFIIFCRGNLLRAKLWIVIHCHTPFTFSVRSLICYSISTMMREASSDVNIGVKVGVTLSNQWDLQMTN